MHCKLYPALVLLIYSNSHVAQLLARHKRAICLLKNLHPDFLQYICAPLAVLDLTASKMLADRQTHRTLLAPCSYFCQCRANEQDKIANRQQAGGAIDDESCNHANASKLAKAEASWAAIGYRLTSRA